MTFPDRTQGIHIFNEAKQETLVFSGFEKDSSMTEMVDYYFDEWVGEVQEALFDINTLVVNQKNIIVSAHNSQVKEACARHGVEVRVVPYRNKYFWDAGIHCITNDLSRDGKCKNWMN